MAAEQMPRVLQPLAQDLFDALWLEDLYGFRARCQVTGARDAMQITLDPDGDRLLWQGELAEGLRPFRVGTRCTLVPGQGPARALALEEIAVALEQAQEWHAPPGQLGQPFAMACEQARFGAGLAPTIVARLRAQPQVLAHWEAVASLRDRPFHPLARAKPWSASPRWRDQLSAEQGWPIELRWVAVPNARWQASKAAATTTPAETLLPPSRHVALTQQARRRGIDPSRHRWLPMHPWQHAHWERTHGWQADLALDLGYSAGAGHATASSRTLALRSAHDLHLKLSLSAPLLGAVRSLPPRHLHNGMQAQACLERLRQQDPWLGEHLHLCDERQWWTAAQPGAGLETDPGELACQLRRYPPLPPAAVLLPMAALPVATIDGALPAFEVLLGPLCTSDERWMAFTRIAELTLELGLRCFGAGVMPEMHGQNVLLAWRGAHPIGVVLRDHDTLRICPRLMHARALTPPEYVLAEGPNTLVLDSAEALLGYLQTLLVEVNLYAVLAAIAEHHREDEARGWQAVSMALRRVLARVGLPPAIAAQARHLLLQAPCWPFKQVLRPLLAQARPGSGMPSAMGLLPNPLRDHGAGGPA